VPYTLVGKTLWLRATDGCVSIYEDYRLVATHTRARKPGVRSTVRDHLPPEARAFFAQDRSWCASQAARVGPACTEFIERLLTDRIVERLRAAQGVLRFAKTYGPTRLEAACARALAHASPFYRTVKTILIHGYDLQPPEVQPSPEPYASAARFTRDAGTLFHPEPNAHH
jgi:hypothetical protein